LLYSLILSILSCNPIISDSNDIWSSFNNSKNFLLCSSNKCSLSHLIANNSSGIFLKFHLDIISSSAISNNYSYKILYISNTSSIFEFNIPMILFNSDSKNIFNLANCLISIASSFNLFIVDCFIELISYYFYFITNYIKYNVFWIVFSLFLINLFLISIQLIL